MSKPINIPMPNRISNQKKKINSIMNTFSSSSSFSPTSSPSNNYRLIIKGGPYQNLDTMKKLIKDCVPDINSYEVDAVLFEANINKQSTLLISKKEILDIYCRNLIENGLMAMVESI